jgi:hypothetical protein
MSADHDRHAVDEDVRPSGGGDKSKRHEGRS